MSFISIYSLLFCIHFSTTCMIQQLSMKVHQFARGFLEHEPPSLTLGCKRFRPLARSAEDEKNVKIFDLKSFIRPQCGSRKFASSNQHINLHQVETHPGGTRWNPTQEQIGILEMLYKGGMRTPNAQQIERITEQLSKYGKIEGKNVFYWFQNHKARERQKQKRNSLGLSHYPRTPAAADIATTILNFDIRGKVENEEDYSYKKMCRSWRFESLKDENIKRPEDESKNMTLELFPLHPDN